MSQINELIQTDKAEKNKSLFKQILTSFKNSLITIIPEKETLIQEEITESLLFNLRKIEDPYLAEKLLDEMTDKEILGNHSIIDLLKNFHPDTLKSQWDWFHQEVREKITTRLLSIHKKTNNDSRSSNTSNNYANSQFSDLMYKAMLEITLFKQAPLYIIEKCIYYIAELQKTWLEATKEIKCLLQKTEEAIIESIEHLWSDSIALPPSIEEEKILDQILKIEQEHNLDWTLLKTLIIQYLADHHLINFYNSEKAKEKIRKLGWKYNINTKGIRKDFSRREKHMFPQYKTTHPKYQSTPKNHKKYHN